MGVSGRLLRIVTARQRESAGCEQQSHQLFHRLVHIELIIEFPLPSVAFHDEDMEEMLPTFGEKELAVRGFLLLVVHPIGDFRIRVREFFPEERQGARASAVFAHLI